MADGGGGANYKLSATLELQDQLSGKLRSVASSLKSVDGAVSKLGSRGEVARLARQFDALGDLRKQVEQFKQMKKSVSATRQAYEQANAATARLAQQYKQGQSLVAQLQTKHDDLKKTFEGSQSATAQLKNKLGGLQAEAAKAKTSGAVSEYQKLQSQIKATSAELKASQAMTRSTGTELKTLAGGVKQAQRELKNIGNAFEQSKDKARQLKRELQTQEPALNRLRQSLNAQGFSTQDLANSDRQLRRRMAETSQRLYNEQRIENLRGALSAAGMTLPTRAGNIKVNVSGNASSTLGKIKTQLSALTQKTWNVAVNAKNSISDKASEITNGVMLGMGAQVLGVAGIGYSFVDALKSQMGFEKQMSAVQAVIGYEKSEMANLTAAAEQIGYTTKFTAAEAAKAQYYAAMAGWKEPQIISGTQGIVNLAAAGDVDLKRTADVVTDLMTAFGLKAGEQLHFSGKPVVESTQHFVDSMAAMITNSNTDIEQGYEALKYSAPVVSAMYADQSAEARADAMRDSLIITGLMANAGVKGSQAGTSQRALYSRLASENRNAFFAERALPVDFVDKETGQVRRLRDIISDFRDKFNNGLDPEQVLEFAEQISGEKIHADTRRKLNSFIDNVQKNGGQMTGADRLKMTSMLAGQEAMSGWLSVFLASEEDWNKIANAIDNCEGRAKAMADIQMDNLAGDVTLLGSAWDAFSRNLLKGDASAGLREFTQGLTGVLSTANNLFKDGVQIGDFFSIGVDAISRLKNKFIELDGVGSLLAGGALFYGMKKILSMALNLKDTLSTWSKIRTMSDLGGVIRGNQGVGGITSSVGTMHVSAGVVNVNGAVRNAGTPSGQRGSVVTSTAGGKPVTSTGGIVAGGTAASSTPSSGRSTIARQNSAYVENYYARKGAITSVTPPTTVTTGTGAASTLKANLGGVGVGVVLAGLFAAMDIYATRNRSQASNSEAAQAVETQRNMLTELRKSNATQEEINFQTQAVQEAEANQVQVQIANKRAERSAEMSAAGMVAGTAVGAAVGSFIPIVGNLFGGMIGGMLGAWGGSVLSEYASDQEEKKRQAKEAELPASIPAGSVSDFRRIDEETTRQYYDENYQSQLALERKQREEQETDRVLRENAVGISRRQTSDYLESQGINVNELPSKEVTRRHSLRMRGNNVEAADKYEVRQANFQYEQDHALMEYLAKKRDKYNAEWQQRFGGTSLAGEAKFIPDNDRDRELLARYDEEQFHKARQQGIIDSIKSRQQNQEVIPKWYDRKISTDFKTTQQAAAEARATSSHAGEKFFEAVGVKLANVFPALHSENSRTDYSGFAQPNAGKNEVGTSPLGTPSAVSDVSKVFEGIGNFFDSLFFNKASANETTPETNMQISTVQETVQSSRIQPTITAHELNTPNVVQTQLESNASSTLTNLSAVSESITSITQNISTSINEAFSGINESMSTFTTSLSEGFNTSFSGIIENISTFTTSLSEGFNTSFSGITENFSTFTTTLSESFNQIPTMATSAFSMITSAASEGWATIQSEWGQLPSFFEGLWAGAGGAASAAGAAIASGLTSVIGGIIGAWQSAASAISGIISNIASMAASAASALPSFGSVGANAIGAASWRGGFTEINEQGGEIIDLPQGTRIYPHATTMKILQRDIEEGKLNNFIEIGHNAIGTYSWRGGLTQINEHGGEIIDLPQGDRIYPQSTVAKLLERDTRSGYFSSNISSTSFSEGLQNFSSLSQNEFATFPRAFSFNELASIVDSSTSSTNNSRNTTNNGITISGNTFNVRKDIDINEIAFKLFELMSDSNANYAGA